MILSKNNYHPPLEESKEYSIFQDLIHQNKLNIAKYLKNDQVSRKVYGK